MGFFQQLFGKKSVPPIPSRHIEGWPKFDVGGPVKIQLPPGWVHRSEESQDRFRARDAEDETQVSITLYELPAAKKQSHGEIFTGLLGAWENAGFSSEEEVKTGKNHSRKRMNMDDDTFHIMAAATIPAGKSFYFAQFIFTSSEPDFFAENEAIFVQAIESLSLA